MPRTCTCTCNYCRTINDNPGAQENSWLSRNRSPGNLVKIPLFILIVFLVTILGVFPAMLAGGLRVLRVLQCKGVIPGMILGAIFWLWFVWTFSKEYLMNWCPTCSNKCRIDTAKQFANQLFPSYIFPQEYQENLWRVLNQEVPAPAPAPAPEQPVPPPLPADEPSTSTARYLMIPAPAPGPPVPPPLLADEPSTICSIEPRRNPQDHQGGTATS